MFLTRFTINPARRGAHKLLGSPQAMHAAVLSSFAPQPPPTGEEPTAPAQPSRILWRVDRSATTNTHLYILSPARPDLTHLVEQAGWPTTETWQTREYSSLLERLQEGQRWAFRLKANPVHAVRVAQEQRTKPLGHVTVAQQETWLTSRTHKHGFTLAKGTPDALDLLVHDRETIRFKRNNATVTLTTATYDGILHITDAQALRTALVTGIGRAKGYGCGMLTLAPIP
jgi:CRISPR system Cascade subunit CasE